MIESTAEVKRVVVIDRQEYWRELSTGALKERGFKVKSLSTYDYSPETAYFDGEPPDLVVLGCASIKREEREFIEEVLADEVHLLVFCASLPWREARLVFLAGADDVADKPYNPAQLLNTVDEVFKRKVPRDSYQAKEYEGAL
jgi:DNA-binding response OmpR family regulator